MTILVIIASLLAPALAAQRGNLDLRWVSAYAIVINMLTFWCYALDKRRAIQGEWRIPETGLHLLELLGGWPGGFLAQRRLRHKCSKNSYQFMFWIIVLVWQFTAIDSLRNWQFSRATLKYLERHAEYRR